VSRSRRLRRAFGKSRLISSRPLRARAREANLGAVAAWAVRSGRHLVIAVVAAQLASGKMIGERDLAVGAAQALPQAGQSRNVEYPRRFRTGSLARPFQAGAIADCRRGLRSGCPCPSSASQRSWRSAATAVNPLRQLQQAEAPFLRLPVGFQRRRGARQDHRAAGAPGPFLRHSRA